MPKTLLCPFPPAALTTHLVSPEPSQAGWSAFSLFFWFAGPALSVLRGQLLPPPVQPVLSVASEWKDDWKEAEWEYSSILLV